MGVSKILVPQNGWFIMENPIKMDDLGVPLILETPKWRNFCLTIALSEWLLGQLGQNLRSFRIPFGGAAGSCYRGTRSSLCPVSRLGVCCIPFWTCELRSTAEVPHFMVTSQTSAPCFQMRSSAKRLMMHLNILNPLPTIRTKHSHTEIQTGHPSHLPSVLLVNTIVPGSVDKTLKNHLESIPFVSASLTDLCREWIWMHPLGHLVSPQSFPFQTSPTNAISTFARHGLLVQQQELSGKT